MFYIWVLAMSVHWYFIFDIVHCFTFPPFVRYFLCFFFLKEPIYMITLILVDSWCNIFGHIYLSKKASRIEQWTRNVCGILYKLYQNSIDVWRYSANCAHHYAERFRRNKPYRRDPQDRLCRNKKATFCFRPCPAWICSYPTPLTLIKILYYTICISTFFVARCCSPFFYRIFKYVYYSRFGMAYPQDIFEFDVRNGRPILFLKPR